MTCREIILEKLSHLPTEWRCQMADVLCDYISEHNDKVLCSEFKDCETLTSLLEFEVDGTSVCISFKDEHGVTVDRCFDLTNVVNNFLNLLDPSCIASVEDWKDMTADEKMQAMIDRVCEDCIDDNYSTTTTTTSTTTTSTTTTSTTTTTTAAPTTTTTTSTTTTTTLPCEFVQFHNPTGVNHEIFWNACDGSPLGATVTPGQTLTYCVQQGSYHGDPEITITHIGTCG